MDEWTFLDEVDVIAKWPAEHKKFVLEGGKWSERKAGLEALNELMEANPRLSTSSMTIYGELMDEIRKILDRESNIVVVTTTARTVELLAKGLRNKFAGFIGMVLPFLIKRAKDKKKNVRDAVLAAVSAVSDTTSPDRIQKDVVEWFAIPSPESKQTLLAFIFAYFCRQSAPDVPFVKALAPLIVKAASESDVNVRDRACQALGSLKRLMGESISAFIGPISTDNAKMEKIGQYEQEAVAEWTKFAAERPSASSGAGSSAEHAEDGENQQPGAAESSGAPGIDPWTLLEPEDVSKKIDKNVEAQLVDKNWKERVAGAEAVKKEIDAVGRLEISDRLREIMVLMVRIIEKDVNVNVAALAAQVLTGVAQKARFAYAHTANRSFAVVFDKLKDKKAVLRDALVELCDAAANTTPLSAYSEAVSTALSSKNPQTRQQTALFLSRFFAKNDSKTLEVEAVKQLAEPIQKVTNDADKDVREAAIRAVAGLQKSLGENVAKRLMADVFADAMKAEKLPTITEELEKEFGKSASPEMLRLAAQYNLASNSGTSAPAQVKRPVSAVAPKPARPVQNAASRSKPVVPTARRAPSPAQRVPVAAAPPKPKPFVARPAPNFGSSSSVAKPKVAAVKPVPVATTRPTSRVPAVPRATTSTVPTSSTAPLPRLGQTRAAIAPNVVRNGTVPVSTTSQRPVGIARPQTSNGTAGGIERSRIFGPATSGIARPGTSSGIARPPSLSRIARPSSRQSSRTEIQH